MNILKVKLLIYYVGIIDLFKIMFSHNINTFYYFYLKKNILHTCTS